MAKGFGAGLYVFEIRSLSAETTNWAKLTLGDMLLSATQIFPLTSGSDHDAPDWIFPQVQSMLVDLIII